jgi:hypothetical protein
MYSEVRAPAPPAPFQYGASRQQPSGSLNNYFTNTYQQYIVQCIESIVQAIGK